MKAFVSALCVLFCPQNISSKPMDKMNLISFRILQTKLNELDIE